ncbi:MAG TPA: DUF2075 domain-containing protein [Trueperaceae bacterium]|nr:DUF2075 domain-containing protein [Trueperaceae bacterium]
MLVYTASKTEFIDHVNSNLIVAKVQEGFGARAGRRSVSGSEVAAWNNSLQFMKNVLDVPTIPDDAGVAIEFTIPQTAKRIDFIIAGQGRAPLRPETAVIVELKQWTDVACTAKDGVVATFVGGAVREMAHPSYQAWTYAELLQDYNATVQDDDVTLQACAYLHNSNSPALKLPFYEPWTSKAPVFLRDDVFKLQRFIQRFVHYGDGKELLYRIENGRIRPSKSLADHLAELLAGRPEFRLIDDQKVVYETALDLAEQGRTGQKQVYIVEGGPGTGKSVVAINLLVELTNRDQVVQYVTKNAAPRAVYASKLSGSLRKTRINNLFKGSGAYHDAGPDTFQTLVVDEAHRLNAKSGMFKNRGENQVKEIIDAARCSVFFIDESQRIALDDIGRVGEIEMWAQAAGACLNYGKLESQFRCNGSDGYLAWLDHTLWVRRTANTHLAGSDYDFRVVDSPAELRELIVTENLANNKSRMVAGYCWDWRSKKDPEAFDIEFPEHGFHAQWNLDVDGSLWILQPNSVEQVGCIHTCQGLELDYVGVIVGPDFLVRGGEVVTDGFARSPQDSTLRGFKKRYKQDPAAAMRAADEIVKNTYRTLMSRGAKGCFVWSPDEETNEYFRQSL